MDTGSVGSTSSEETTALSELMGQLERGELGEFPLGDQTSMEHLGEHLDDQNLELPTHVNPSLLSEPRQDG